MVYKFVYDQILVTTAGLTFVLKWSRSNGPDCGKKRPSMTVSILGYSLVFLHKFFFRNLYIAYIDLIF